MKKTRQIKRFLSLIIACALCVGMVTVSASAVSTSGISTDNATVTVSDGGNYVVNGGFETGTIDGWSIENTNQSTMIKWGKAVSVTGTEKHSGNYAAMIEKDSEDGYYGYQVIVYNPQVGKDYTISYWGKTTGTAKIASAFLAQGDQSTSWATYAQSWQNGEEHFITATGNWEQRQFDFSVPNNSNIKMITIRMMIYGEGTVYLDDVALTDKKISSDEDLFFNGGFNGGVTDGWSIGTSTEIPPKGIVTDYFVNGDFETVFASNSAYGYNINDAVAEFTTANVHSGEYAVKYTSGYFTNYATSVKPGTYTLSMWVNTVSGDTTEISGYVTGCGIDWLDFAMTPVRGTTDGWVKTSGTVTFTEEGNPQFGFKSYDGTGEVYIDDITLTQEYLEPLTETTELLQNNDFAGGTASWSFNGPSEIINDNGTNTVKMTVPADGNAYIQQTVAVVPGKTYDFSVDLMTQEQDGNDAQAQVWVVDPNWNMICPSEYKTYGWKHLTATYTAPAGVTSVDVLLQHNAVAGVSYWKNVSFSLTETVMEEARENILVNGDFETVLEDGVTVFGFNTAGSEITTANVHGGNHAIKYNSGYFFTTATAVEAGTYELSMWVNTVSGGTVEMSGFVTGCGIPWLDFAMTAVRGTTDGWVKTSGTVTFTEAGAPQFGFKSYDGTGEVYIDDIKLEKVTYKPVYPSSTYTEGIGTFGGDNGMLKADTATEWWNYGTSVTEGQKYTYSMDIKTENVGEGFQFYPYISNFVDEWKIPEVYYTNTDGWTHLEYGFTADAPHATDGTRFGFVRNGVGTVYIDNIQLTAVAQEPAPVITAENEALLYGAIVAGPKNASAKIPVANVVAGKKYILKFNVSTWLEEDVPVSAKLGTAGFEKLKINQKDGSNAVTVEVTAKESGNVNLTFTATAATTILDSQVTLAAAVFDSIELYRAYELGDVNGDEAVDVRDLVRYKKHFATLTELATYIYADMDGNNVLNADDLSGLVGKILAS